MQPSEFIRYAYTRLLNSHICQTIAPILERERRSRRLSHIARVAKTKLSFCLIYRPWWQWRRQRRRGGYAGAISFLSRTTTGTDITDTPMTSDRRICQFLSLTRRFIFFLHRSISAPRVHAREIPYKCKCAHYTYVLDST